MEYREIAADVIAEVSKAVVGKDEIIQKIMMAILAGGHVLVEDMPGVGKTTMAIAFARALGLEEKRVQFTPDVLPSDLTGFTIYKKEQEQFVYQPGAVMCNLLLADEINRTSPKTQSALLEVMEEHQVTVDGVTRATGDPFVVIATQNPSGSAGTQLLPESQLDRFMICLKVGYPTVREEVEILKRNQTGRSTELVENVMQIEELLAAQRQQEEVFVHDRIYTYIAQLAKATREKAEFSMGLSPRGALALCKMAKACAYLENREYVVPEDVRKVFFDVAVHRVVLTTKARVGHIKVQDLLGQVLDEVEPPSLKKR
ncbi:MAG: MoxR family ATPase [Hespellia sp.]|nr:MoxR family ATPase [Hespellia sp.]